MTKPNMTSNALAKTNDNGHFGFFIIAAISHFSSQASLS